MRIFNKFTPLLLAACALTAFAQPNLEVIAEKPVYVVGTLQYATMKYWIETPDGTSIPIGNVDSDDELRTALGQQSTAISGTLRTWSNRAEYLEDVVVVHQYDQEAHDRAGPFSLHHGVSILEEDLHVLKYNDRPIWAQSSMETFAMGLEHAFQDGADSVAMLALYTGGTACPALYRMIAVRQGRTGMSNKFGTCSDLPDITKSKQGLTIYFPGNPWQTYRYQQGVLKQVR